jgi:hypothetical protein
MVGPFNKQMAKNYKDKMRLILQVNSATVTRMGSKFYGSIKV